MTLLPLGMLKQMVLVTSCNVIKQWQKFAWVCGTFSADGSGHIYI